MIVRALFIDAGHIMKKCAMGIAAIVVLSGTPALAAPPASPAWNWTGWYVGGNLGYSWGKDNGPVTFSDPVTGPLLSVNSNTRLDGVIGAFRSATTGRFRIGSTVSRPTSRPPANEAVRLSCVRAARLRR